MSFLQIGFIDSEGHPRLRIHVTGTNPGERVELDALIDTGFTGFLLLPLAQAFPLGLTLLGTTEHALADGTLTTSFIAKGTVTIPAPPPETQPTLPITIDYTEEAAEGAIVLAGEEALVGMGFLTTLKKFLLVGRNTVALMTEMDEAQFSEEPIH